MISIIEYWKTRNKFDENTEVQIPIVDKDIYDSVIIPNIIRCGGISKKDLIVGKSYKGFCRNSNIAIWNGKEFEYDRIKFGKTYKDKINHFEDDNGYDLFIPIEGI